ncbi:helix-turn-helix domain-containing protein [Aciduricibacillus chroicocephali]|uniref:Helix-turn-helix domain-containing protein n=1 Tax=Aciduricibacillus chroicocephali TaxID=3054939 RepID=A0ABY9KYW5_9BACI|nr:helix-turn-helix domain-containing protein [Bacillaceae bacterium 44XB]
MKNSKIGFIKFNVNLMDDYELKVGETLVYGALVSFTNMSILSNTKDEQGHVYAYPPISKIANITGQSERSVKSHIQVLERKGLMTVKRSYKEGGKEKNVNHYYLRAEVLKVYFPADTPAVSDKIAKPKKKHSEVKHKEFSQSAFIANAKIEKWFTHYEGEHNNNSARKLNQLEDRYGAKTVVKAIHNAMNGVNIESLSQGTTGFMLSRLKDGNLEDAQRQLKNEKESQERFMNESISPQFDYKAALKKEKRDNKTVADNIEKLLGGVL